MFLLLSYPISILYHFGLTCRMSKNSGEMDPEIQNQKFNKAGYEFDKIFATMEVMKAQLTLLERILDKKVNDEEVKMEIVRIEATEVRISGN